MDWRQTLKDLAYRCGVEVRRAHPLPRSGEVPSFTDPFHEQRRLLSGVAAPVIFDVGAHIGQTAAHYKRLFPESRVFAFEPFEDSFAQLEARARNLSGVFPVNMALGKEAREAILNVNRSSATNSLLPTDPRACETWNGSDVTETIAERRVKVTTVDAFLRERQLERVDVLKLDAQGSEMDILLGARGALAQGAIRLLYSEIIVMPTYVGQSHLDDYLAYLRGLGYELHNFFNFCHTNDGRLNQVDALFVRRDLAKAA